MKMRAGQGIFVIGEMLLFIAAASGLHRSPYYTLPWQEISNLEPRQLAAKYLPEELDDDYELRLDTSEAYRDEDRLSRNDRSLLPEYRSLCETMTRKVEMKNDPIYEYQPPHYHEVFCKSYFLMDDEPQKSTVTSKQKCAHPSFHCVQRSRTLFMTRRRWDTDCWEPVTKVVASGCDCMWPVSSLGDVSIHY